MGAIVPQSNRTYGSLGVWPGPLQHLFGKHLCRSHPFWLVNKNWCWSGLDVLVWMTLWNKRACMVNWWEYMYQQWTVLDRFMMDNSHDCPITDVWSLFLCSCLLIIVRNKGIPTVIVRIPRSIPQSALYLLCMHALTVWQKVRVRRLIFYIPWSI